MIPPMQVSHPAGPLFELRPKGAAFFGPLLLLVLNALLCAGIGTWMLTHHKGFGAALFCLVAAAAFAVAAWGRLTLRIVFRPEQIAFESSFSSRIVQRDELAGWQVRNKQFQIEFRDRSRNPILIDWIAEDDPRLRSWIGDLPEFDPDDWILKVAEGAKPERVAALASAKRLTLAVNIMGSLAVVWFVATGNPGAATLLMLVPVAAFVMTLHPSGLIRFEPDYPNAALAVLMTALGLPLRTALETTSVNKDEAWVIAAAVGVVFCMMVAGTTRIFTRHHREIPIVLIMALAYGYGAGMQLNRQLDFAPTVHQKAEVLRKYMGSGNNRYYVRLAPWGKRLQASAVEVDEPVWRSLIEGDLVCIPVHGGALGVQWFNHWQVTACQ
jgi:hypothetical protein